MESEPNRLSSTAKPVGLLLFLRLVGGVSLLAFAAAVMPEQWIIETAQWLGFDPFPDSPLTFYLARNLSLLYGFVGATLFVVSTDLPRYFPLVRYAAIGTMLFGVLQLIVDLQAALPLWWTLGESFSTFFGGVLLYWIESNAPVQAADARLNE
ncbi:MAG: hypothetical protein JJ992_23535 [Planctomycetes bacterium]|nr:hypothetical protein [Planctomycetota bacterium]